MNPNYNQASAKAYETRTQFGSSDPLHILRRLSNVLVISFDAADMPVDQDAFTCVDQNKYIVFYNSSLSPVLLRSSLARELGHVILQHDGKDPEEVWLEEAMCFAYHFLCPPPSVCISVKYRPDRATISMSFKDMQTFDSILALKESVAAERTRFMHFIGHDHIIYTSNDVDILSMNEEDFYGHWKNYSTVLVAGNPVGFCGE